MAKTVPIEIRVTDAKELRGLIDAALDVLRTVESRGVLYSHDIEVADLHRAFEQLSQTNDYLTG